MKGQAFSVAINGYLIVAATEWDMTCRNVPSAGGGFSLEGRDYVLGGCAFRDVRDIVVDWSEQRTPVDVVVYTPGEPFVLRCMRVCGHGSAGGCLTSVELASDRDTLRMSSETRQERVEASPVKPAAGPWIPCTARMPARWLCVLAWDADDGEHIAQWEGTGWLSSDGGMLMKVTYWAEVCPPESEE